MSIFDSNARWADEDKAMGEELNRGGLLGEDGATVLGLDDPGYIEHEDPEWAYGSVLAQIEDLEPIDRIKVLECALATVKGWHQPEAKWGNVDGYGVIYYDQAPLLLPSDHEADVTMMSDHQGTVSVKFPHKAEAELFYRKLEGRVRAIGLYLRVEGRWMLLERGEA